MARWPLSCLVACAEQRAKAVKHVASTMTLTYYPIQCRPYLIKIGWHLSQKSQRCAAVCHNCCQGLFYFMSD